METLDIYGFIKAIHPFDTLGANALREVAEGSDICYFKPGETILAVGQAPEFYYLIAKGAVREENPEGDATVYGPSDTFDAVSILNDKARGTFVAIDETLCFALPKETFSKLIHSHGAFESYYLEDMGRRLQTLLAKNADKEPVSFMVGRVKESYIHPAVIVPASSTIHQSVTAMTEADASAALVDYGDITGIFTDSDLRKKVVLANLPLDTPIGKVANRNLVTVDENDFLFNALLLMTGHGIKRLAVTREGAVIGTLEQADLLSAVSHKSHLMAVKIRNAADIDQLKTAGEEIRHLIRSLQSKGVKVRHITKLVSEINGQLYKKAFQLTFPEALREHACLLLLGSEGRKEQTLRTDQDNALLLRDGAAFDPEALNQAANAFTDALLACGFPPCPGNVMVSNPLWRNTVEGFRQQVFDWMHAPVPENLMQVAILLDARAVAGDKTLLEAFKEKLPALMTGDQGLLSAFARATVMFDTPIGLFSGFVTDKKDREHKDELDLKKGGVFPIVHGIRSLALEKGIQETNTVERIKKLNDLGLFNREFAADLIEAFDFLLTLRLSGQLDKMKQGLPPDNYLAPEKLSKLERDLLRDVFKVVNQLKKLITHHFKLGTVG